MKGQLVKELVASRCQITELQPEHKQTEEALKSSKKHFQTLIEEFFNCIVVINSDGNVRYVSPSIKQILEYEPEELIGKTFFDLIHPDDLQNRNSGFVKLLQAENNVVSIELLVKHKDESWRTIECIGKNLLGNPSIVGIVIGIQAITESEQKEKELIESERRYKVLVDTASKAGIGIAVVQNKEGKQGKLVFVNEECVRISGYSEKELLDMTFTEFLPQNAIPYLVDNYMKRQSGETIVPFYETAFLTKSGVEIPIEITAEVMVYEGKLSTMAFVRDIAWRKQMEGKYRQLLEDMKDGYAVLQDGIIVFANKKFSELFEFEPEQVIGYSLINFIAPDALQGVMDLYTKVISGAKETPEEIEVIGIKRNGTLFPIHGDIRQIEYEGKPAYSVIVKDITERKQAEEAMQRSKEYFQALIDNAYDACMVLDETGGATYLSPSIKRTLGYEPEDIVGNGNLFELTHPEDIQTVAGKFVEIIAIPGGTMSMELRVKHKDGSWRHIEGTGTNLFDHPSIQGFICNIRDVTDRKIAEVKFRQLLGDINDGYAIYQNNKIVLANPRLGEMLGYTADQLLGKNFFMLIAPESIREATDEYIRVVKEEGKVRGQYELLASKNDGTRVIMAISAKNIEYEGKPAFSATIRDITMQKKAQEELEALYNAEITLRQALEEEKERKAEFTRVLVHELRTPLTSVMSSSEALLEVLTDGISRRLANNINRGAINLGNRVDDLLDLAKGDIGMLRLKLESVDLLRLIRKVTDYMDPVARSYDHSIILDLPQSLPLIQADETRLQQVMLNLLNNASKFTPSGGKITIRAGRKDSAVVVEVQDTGTGISEEQRQRLFEPYNRVENDRNILNGLGLGLALCKTLVELHGGQIWVESHLGEGSTFGFSLPLEDSYVHL